MTRQALLDLAARCEAATGADRELNDAIASEIFTGKHRVRIAGLSDEAGGLWLFTYPNGSIGSALRFTASLDAAMSLVPEGWLWQIGAYARGEVCAPAYYRAVLRRWVRGVDGELSWPRVSRTSATPALALTAACLKALAQEIEHD